MDSSELSSPLSSIASDDIEPVPPLVLNGPPSDLDISSLESVSSTPPKRRREPSPPHEVVLADNPDIAFIVMFRSRFNDAFPTKLINFGPQDIERGVVEPSPSPQVESLLCALLALVLNRKKPVERGHHGRALEEAVQTQKSQWPRAWNGANPLAGGRTFNSMTPLERLGLLKALILWALNTSEAIGAIIRESYKQSRHDDDLNQPLSVHPWGKDGNKRRYWLIEGRDDTPFRLYRESNPALKTHTWRSMAGTIEELREVADKLKDEGSQAARRLGDRVIAAIPRFEASEEKIKRREYRLQRKAQFARAEPGFSLYEGRTRGKRMRYTFDDDEEDFSLSDALPARRSTRHSSAATPADPAQPTVTASGRHVRARVGGLYGETLHSGQQTSTGRPSPATDEYERSELSEEPPVGPGRSTRASGRTAVNGWTKGRKHIEGYNSLDEMDDEDEASSSGAEWDGGDEDEPDEPDNDMDMDDSEEDDFDSDLEEPQSLVVTLRYRKPGTGDPTLKMPGMQESTFKGNTPSIHIEPPSVNTIQNTFNAPLVGLKTEDHPMPAAPQTNGGFNTFRQTSATMPAFSSAPEIIPTKPNPPFQSPGFGPSTLPYSPPKPTVLPIAPLPQTPPYPTPASSATTSAAPPLQFSSASSAQPPQNTVSKGSIQHYFHPASSSDR